MKGREFPVVAVQRADDGPQQRAVRITCAACGGSEDLVMPKISAIPPEIQVKKFVERGWEVGSAPRLDFCPACQPKRNKRMARRPRGATQEAEPVVVDIALAPPAPTGRMIAELYMVLDDCYDLAEKDYKPGCSDELVAAQVNLPVAVVAERRAKDFGPIKDRRAGELNDAAQSLAGELEHLLARVDDVRACLASLYQQADKLAGQTKELAGS